MGDKARSTGNVSDDPDIDDEGEVDVEWYPLPAWIAEAIGDEDPFADELE